MTHRIRSLFDHFAIEIGLIGQCGYLVSEATSELEDGRGKDAQRDEARGVSSSWEGGLRPRLAVPSVLKSLHGAATMEHKLAGAGLADLNTSR